MFRSCLWFDVNAHWLNRGSCKALSSRIQKSVHRGTYFRPQANHASI